ncbi:MAG: hypothetical protein PHQ43_04350 [Dehalococcoidales bacterium]|nr:hypothetical protein [Dehalococcoidales bacterium]
MKLVYGISSWTNPSRPHARHIDDGHGRPLCGGKSQKKVFSWERDEGKPTCERCIQMYKKLEG